MASLLKNIAEPYNKDKVYNTKDMVLYNNLLYLCIYNNVSGEFNSSKWIEVQLTDLVQGKLRGIEDYSGKVIDASYVEQDDDYAYFGVPQKAFVDNETSFRTLNSNLKDENSIEIISTTTYRDNKPHTQVVSANSGKYILCYMTLSQYPDGTIMSCTNATEVDVFTVENNTYYGVKLFKITDTSKECIVTFYAKGDYGTPGGVVRVLDSIQGLDKLTVSVVKEQNGSLGTLTIKAGEAKYILAYISLSQYYHSAGHTGIVPEKNIEIITPLTLFYPIGHVGACITLALFKIVDTAKDAQISVLSVGDYGNKNVCVKYLN